MSDLQTVRSISYSQREILEWIMRLHCPDGFECDLTYGNGAFWRDWPHSMPRLLFDVAPRFPGVQKSCSTNLPLPDSCLQSVVFDPPFLTYIRPESKMLMARRFSGFYRYEELQSYYEGTLQEVNRVLSHNGVLVFKCQDIIHNHKMHCTHVNVVNWAQQAGFRLADLFVLLAKNRIPVGGRRSDGGKPRTQKHARIFHCYFLVLKKLSSADAHH